MADILHMLLPAQASDYAHSVDLFALAFMALIIALSAPVFILIVFFAIRYRRGKQVNRVHPPRRNMAAELSWSILPFLCLLGFYVWSTMLFASRYNPPSDAVEIAVVAKQWMWKFQHPEGNGEINELHVPVGQAIRLTMTSEDVIHSLFVPAMRLKQDVLPGRYTMMWFTPSNPGIFPLACAEFCGADHSVMGGRVIAMEPEDYARWLASGGGNDTLASEGKALFMRFGCSGCHGPSSTVHAPKLEGLYGQPVPLSTGEIVTADRQYIHDSIVLPQKQIAAGYPPIMPTFQNVLSEEDVLKLTAYIQSLSGKAQPRP